MWWHKVAAAEDKDDKRARQCHLKMLSEIAWKLARDGFDKDASYDIDRLEDIDRLKDIGNDPHGWVQWIEDIPF